MSNVKIALQPPPNVDFVVGYPGIPPGARDRPQAAVKGAVEVRVGPSGAKAKWVRVELKKIETLPGGGQANSYFDHVGPSPISLWQSSEDYGVLQSQDFPFLIRIPESIPPSIALERGAGIRYELVATVCTLGKKGFFRRRKTAIISQATTIIVDKHELHSTWPVYSQPESRSVTQDGVHLTVERARTCYGPGDRVSVMAILKSDSVQPVILRGFEFTLKETTIFRAGPQATASAKRSGPQVKTANIGEQKVPLNVTLYGGTQHKAEVGCLIPNTHTTTSLNAARHIDITYVIVVRAWIGSMQSVTMELPVIVSNWPRNVSEEAVRRIGVAPSLCMTSPSSPAATVPITTSTSTRPLTGDSAHHSITDFSNFSSGRGPLVPPKQSVQYSTAPVGHNGSAGRGDELEVDELGELGYGRGTKATGTIDHPGYGSSNAQSHTPGLGGIAEDGSAGAAGGIEARPSVTGSGGGRRRRPSATGQQQSQNRFTITNISEKDAAEGINAQTPRASPGTPPSAGRPGKSWPTAEDEKKQLYENAVARVQKVQGTAAVVSTTSLNETRVWPTAEDEKVRLYDKAQATAKRTQAYGAYSPSIHSRSSSEANASVARDKPSSSAIPGSSAGPGPAISAGAALYQQAVSSMAKASNPNSNASAGASSRTPPSPPSSGSGTRSIPHYPSAEEEKAALKRYHDAKLAVDRNQNTQYASREAPAGAAPISYDTLYPQNTGGGAGGSSQAGGSDMPPPFESGSAGGQPQYVNEKERLRRQYEAQDAAALAQQGSSVQLHSIPSYTAQTPAYDAPPPPMEGGSGLSEKEILRRRYEEQDAAAFAQQQMSPPQPPPPRVNGTRAPPVPPVANGFRPLTAAEEKAQLNARYAAEERAANGMSNGNGFAPHPYANGASSSAPPPPPPLMPRPPVEYIHETQQEDLRGRFYDAAGVDEGLDGLPSMHSSPSLLNPHIDIRPFTPFDAGFGYESGTPSVHGRPPPPPPPPRN
ncbi:hypothetical protein HYDPIDRAFT_177738 [Hydnomerulius pinastri MD-312]|uniref:Arrestin C-terminal-like domain-containing protein n=1 Tax=Hydnomerulius pinastri MD-312 TaxID=994086 RepID=A0A0C9VPW4_9AGAM|nr:hypothetical protein HYDPIDRAFT_177738 [Hydnomerulius pinastri MD-312]